MVDESAKITPLHKHDQFMNMLAYVMMVCAEVILGLASDRWVLVAPYVIITTLHPMLMDKLNLRLGLVGYAALAIPFAALAQGWEAESANGVFDFNLGFYSSLYLLSIAIARLFSPPSSERIPVIIVCTGLTVAASGVAVPARQYIPTIIIFCSALVLVLRRYMLRQQDSAGSRKLLLRTGVLITCCLAIVMTIFSARVIRAYYYDVDRWFNNIASRLMLKPSVGFSESSSLGNISDMRFSEREMAITIRAFGESLPGYLRGKIYHTYGSSRWSCAYGYRTFSTDKKENLILNRFVMPGRKEPVEGQEPDFVIHPVSDYAAHFFLPGNTDCVDSASRNVRFFPGNILYSQRKSTTRGYEVYVSNAPLQEYDYTKKKKDIRMDIGTKYLAVPPNPAFGYVLDRVIEKLEVPKESITPDIAVAALVRYFHKNYRYKIGIRFRPGLDPIYQFLTEKNHGHCELFATSGVLLLRRMGIPARYVTGFVCAEHNPYSNMWISRQKDAHAWAEYYHPTRGWQTAEFTPPGGIPEPTKQDWFDNLTDYFKSLLVRAKDFLMREGMKGVFNYLFSSVGSFGKWLLGEWWRILILALLVAYYLYTVLKGKFGGVRRTAYSNRNLPQDVIQLRELYLSLEKDLKRKGLIRLPHETLETYASKIEATTIELEEKEDKAALVRKYAMARYSPFDVQGK